MHKHPPVNPPPLQVQVIWTKPFLAWKPSCCSFRMAARMILLNSKEIPLHAWSKQHNFFLCCTPRNTGYVHLGRFHELNNAVGLRFTRCIISNLIQKRLWIECLPVLSEAQMLPGRGQLCSHCYAMLPSSPRNTHITKWKNRGRITQPVTSTALTNRDGEDLKSSVMMTGGQMSFKCCWSQSSTHAAYHMPPLRWAGV